MTKAKRWISSKLFVVEGASQATSCVETEQPDVAALATDGPASTHLAQDLRGGSLRGRGQGLPTEAKVITLFVKPKTELSPWSDLLLEIPKAESQNTQL